MADYKDLHQGAIVINGLSDILFDILCERLKGFNDEHEFNILIRLIKKYCSENGIDHENRDLQQTRPAFGGNIMATIRSSNYRPQATVRPKVMRAPEPDADRSGKTIREEVLESDTDKIKKIVEIFHSDEATVNLSDVQIIISGGKTMKRPPTGSSFCSNSPTVRAMLSEPAVRLLTTDGYLTHIRSARRTKQRYMYITCGISGQIQHLIGMQSYDTIIAIDSKPDTPMIQLADIAVVGELFEVIPGILNEMDRSEGRGC